MPWRRCSPGQASKSSIRRISRSAVKWPSSNRRTWLQATLAAPCSLFAFALNRNASSWWPPSHTKATMSVLSLACEVMRWMCFGPMRTDQSRIPTTTSTLNAKDTACARFCQTSLDTVTNSGCPAESRYGGAVDVQRAVDLYSQGCLARWLGDPLEHVRQKVLDVLVGDRGHHCWHASLDQERMEVSSARQVRIDSPGCRPRAWSEICQSGGRASRSWYVVTGVAGRLAQPPILSC